MCFSAERRAIFRHQNFKKCSRTRNIFCERAFRHSGVQFFDIRTSKSAPGPSIFFVNMLFATAASNFSTSELQKVLRDRQFFNILTCECAFRHSGVQFLDIRTSKSSPKLMCFVHFHFKMCFSPQQRAIFDFSSEHLPPHPPL